MGEGIGKLALPAPAEHAGPRRTFYVAAIMLLMGKGVKQVVDNAGKCSGPGAHPSGWLPLPDW